MALLGSLKSDDPILFICLALCAGLLNLLFSNIITTEVDLPSQTITITRNNLLLPDRQTYVRVKQVQGIEIHTRRRKGGRHYSDFGLLLQSDKFISLISERPWSEKNTREMAHKLGNFLNKPVSKKDLG